MPLFITQGRFTSDAMKGMLAKPEDRTEAISDLLAKSGGRLIAYYYTFGEYDFLIVSEGPIEGVATSAIAAMAGGGVTDLKTTLAMTAADMKTAFTKAGSVAKTFRSAGAQAH
ncbi:GYD domain-containing protein [Microvirga thermotolerans]|uniref:GYD domain-containing protein n=1 Tax=Microvirga thermotolerans TaxID=2651334 RepID=A0A5P9JWL4_9HYPH|nr:GYD domain-containing protein [Microvirga thermotolerans]QFU16128.1 GYD domain-containing protein [Microvirga thermotolerans]